MRKEFSRYKMMCRAAAHARKARSKKNATKEFIQQRFWSKVDRRGPNECWTWTAGVAGRGYGAFRINKGKINAHRFAWECFNGPIPKGLIACHHCDNVVCCNPRHIFIGTSKDNMQDCISKGRLNPPKGERHGCSKLTEKDVVEIRKRYSSGETSKEIAKDFPVRKQTVRDIISGSVWKDVANRVPCIVRPRIGENHWHHKLTKSDVIEIRKLYIPRKITMQHLSAMFGVAVETIFDVIHHRCWRDVKLERV